MTINEATGVTPFRQLAEALREQIANGSLAVGTQLPSARELAATYDLALTTAVKAVEQLRVEGLVQTHRGRGTFVAKAPEFLRRGAGRYRRNAPKQRQPTNLAESGEVGWIDHVEARITPRVDATADIARRLMITEGEPVSVVRYLWFARDQTVAQISTQWEPLNLTGNTSIETPVDGTAGNPGVIERFDSIGIYVDHVTETLKARMPNTEESEIFKLSPGVPVLHLERTHHAGETPVETANIVMRADKVMITSIHDVSMPEESN